MSPWDEITSAEVVLRMVLVATAYGILFAAAELTRALRGFPGESTRRLVHVGGGCIALALPWVFVSPWPVVSLAVAFVALLSGSKHLGVLGSIHDVPRCTLGAYLYPVGIAYTFALAHTDPSGYVVAILALALGDTAAGVVGGTFGRRRYWAWQTPRSIEGSAAAAIVTLVVTLGVIATGSGLSWTGLAVAASVALAVALVEGASPVGTDNVTVPLAALLAFWAAETTLGALVLLALAAAAFAAGMLATRTEIAGPSRLFDFRR